MWQVIIQYQSEWEGRTLHHKVEIGGFASQEDAEFFLDEEMQKLDGPDGEFTVLEAAAMEVQP